MTSPADLAYPEKFPADLKVLLTEQKVPANDPLVLLLAWHWLRMDEMREVIEIGAIHIIASLNQSRAEIMEDRLKVEAALDNRLGKLNSWQSTLEDLFDHLSALSTVLKEKPLAVSQNIEKELTQPVAESVKSVKHLAVDVAGLLADVDKAKKRLRRSNLITAFLSGYATAALIVTWTYFHFFSHYLPR
jgi:hypothetical protein